ncbi:hypothetical protein EJ05DRAFT_502987 [Pseudovirgaria hyperparasitica]|uniref:Uncharacterized protein n=1 Tax=Pseudovirgaria hyperparasitica TaxID=470096 RepID=A0A6A6W3B8_9PEZI|nr:uncharacterized protein EJ05DRAFT_502987 [Pseudovirgaria hyperparasitica]KAF2755531.1 hypothetical protein EJ05DRAFT_502987 [Pseudovirgaria hyperparasitica]
MAQIGLSQEWHSALQELCMFDGDEFDHRDVSLWKYILRNLEGLSKVIDIDGLLNDYDPHPALFHAIFCDIRLINYDFQFAKFLESRLTELPFTESVAFQQTFKNGFSDHLLYTEWRNSYALVPGRSVNATGGLKSVPWLRYLYDHSTFRDEDYEKAFLDAGYHRARPVETLGRLEQHLCSLVGGRLTVSGETVGGTDERWKHLALCASSCQWLRLAPVSL